MSISEAERNEIYESFKTHHGERVASNLMSMLPPVGWADVATKSDLHTLEVALRSEGAGLEARLDQRVTRLEAHIDQRFGQVDQQFGQVDQRFTQLEAAIVASQADLRTEVHQSIRNQTWALVGWTTALAGFILAIGR